jgi:hypothetical protein
MLSVLYTMDILQIKLGKDVFGIILTFYDPVRESQEKRKFKIERLFYDYEIIPHKSLLDCIRFYDDPIWDKRRKRNIRIPQSIFKECCGSFNAMRLTF